MDPASIATGRAESLFTQDCRSKIDELRHRLDGARVLAIGAAGSIGSATVREFSEFSLRSMHIVDHDENGLAEMVRDLRGAGLVDRWNELRLLPLDFGSSIMERFLREGTGYDVVINFAAVKHVRSEKDSYSALHLLATNVLRHADCMSWLHDISPHASYFSVSTDKAANPVNLMGASKRLMEHVVFARSLHGIGHATSARFANVAFSNGSLLQGWQIRLAKGQPLAVPRESRRYFVSQRESGQLCLLASAYAGDRHIIVPRLDPAVHLRRLEDIARAFLAQQGLTAIDCADLAEASSRLAELRGRGQYPLLLTPLDTEGEKSFEEFVGKGESTVEIGLPNLLAVAYDPGAANATALRVLLDELRLFLSKPDVVVDKRRLLEIVAANVPEFQHADHSQLLDNRF